MSSENAKQLRAMAKAGNWAIIIRCQQCGLVVLGVPLADSEAILGNGDRYGYGEVAAAVCGHCGVWVVVTGATVRARLERFATKGPQTIQGEYIEALGGHRSDGPGAASTS